MDVKYKTASLAILLCLMTLSAAAQGDSGPGIEEELKNLNLTELEERFNSNTRELPGFVGSLIGDQYIAVNLSGVESGSRFLEKEVIGIRTEGRKTSRIQWGPLNRTTLKIWIDQSDLEELSTSGRPLKEFRNMLKDGRVRYETYTLGNKIKMAIISFFL